MPRFIVRGLARSGWIARHNRDVIEPKGSKDSESAHRYVQGEANWDGRIWVEIADELGEPCTLFPNTISPERSRARPEIKG